MSEIPQILILENDAIVSGDLSDTLSRRGYAVLGIADSIERALVLLGERKPELYLIDLRFGPDGDGIEAANLLRKKWAAPVVFMTGFSSEEIFNRAKEVGSVVFLRKPFSGWELQAAVEAGIKHGQQQRGQQEQGDRFLNALSTLSEAVIASDLSGMITFFNAAAENLTCNVAAEVIGRPLAEVMKIQDFEIADSVENEAEGGAGRLLVLTTAEGRHIKILERSSPLRNESGEVMGLLTLFRQWNENSVAARTADESDAAPYVPFCELFDYSAGDQSSPSAVPGEADVRNLPVSAPARDEQLLDGITDPLLTLDENEVISYANPEASACLSKGVGVLIGQGFRDLFSTQAGEDCGVKLNKIRESRRRLCFEIHDEESERWFELNVYPRGEGWLVLLRDVSARKQEDVVKLQAHRLEGLSLLARGFTHDFNNLLTVLIGNLSLIKDRYLDDQSFQSEVRASSLAADQARRLVQQLMTFTKGGLPIMTETKVAGVLRRVLEEHRKSHAKIRYQMTCEDPSLRVRIDPEQIALLLENLVKNAEESMPNGGRLEAVCELCMEDVDLLPAESGQGDEGVESYVVIKIIDDGHGMDETILARVFEPYFTTRKEDNASGIGLTVCESIAKAHRGQLTISSEPGIGTQVSLYLPLQLGDERDGENGEENYVGSEDEAAAYVEIAPVREGAARILILEDEHLIRQLIVRCLSKQGYEVVESADGEETLRLYQEAMAEQRPFDLVLSDLTIEGGVGGVEMMESLRKIDPQVRAIVSSGYSDAPAMAHPEDYGFVAVLPKPYPPQDLIRVVKKVIESWN